jgi:hypothetical protein
MRAYVGAGWYIHHLTDRVVALRKEDYLYRKVTGRDGYVTQKVQVGMTRSECLEEAIKNAQKNDEKLAFLVAKEIIPQGSKVQTYQMKAHRLNRCARTDEDESAIGRKRV